MQSSLLRFIDVLRSHSLPVSPAETLDAAAAMDLVGYGDRAALRDALAATLAKSRQEEEVFDDCFERFFTQREQDFSAAAPRGSEEEETAADNGDGPDENSDSQGDAGGSGEGNAMGGGADGERLEAAAGESPALQRLLDGELLTALLENQRGTLSTALRRAAAESELDRIRLFTQKGQYTRRILDALGEGEIRDAVLELERAGSPALDTLRRYRDVLRDQVRDFVEQQYLLHAEGRNDSFMDEVLSRTRL